MVTSKDVASDSEKTIEVPTNKLLEKVNKLYIVCMFQNYSISLK